MDAKQSALYEKLMAFEFEQGPTSLTFADRLAKENGWRVAYAQRVIDEYKRFLFLAMAADHPVSPSDPVDQAWHLHLVYTRSYWDDLCRDMLGRPLHHGPTLGGAAEQHKHNDWYERTLASYRSFFADEPPSDIWPSLATWKRSPTRYERVDRERFWLMPKVRLPRLSTKRSAGAASLIALPLIATLNPLDMSGKQFLLFYAILFGVALVLGIVLRMWSTATQEPSEKDLDVDADELAYLNGGQKQMTQAVIAGMIHQGTIELRNEKKGWLSSDDPRLYAVKPLPTDADKLARLVHKEADQKSGLEIKSLPAVVAPLAERVKQSLEDRGLLSSAKRVWIAGVPMAIVLLLGIAKLGVGLWRDKPVGFLIFGCIVAGVATWLLIKPSRLSGKGRSVLSSWKSRHAHLQTAPTTGDGVSATDMALAVGMFGLAATAIPPFHDLRKALGSGNTGSSCGTSCGSGGSCGSSCGGGGGCGGGGCGGCGGGGD
jgi:uncharacterized protein (TIGR04222 family)